MAIATREVEDRSIATVATYRRQHPLADGLYWCSSYHCCNAVEYAQSLCDDCVQVHENGG